MPRALNGEIVSEWFVAKITGVGASSGSAPCAGIPHAWTTLKPCPDQQNFQDPPVGYPAVVGTTTKAPAFAIDGSAATVGDLVLMRQRNLASTGNPVMEFLKTSVSSSTANARVKIAAPDGDGKIGILQIFTGTGTVLSFSDGDRVFVHEVNGFTADLPINAVFLAQELDDGIYGVQLDPTAVISAICDETGLTVTTRM